jgi:phosphatidylglycerol:prolipoprotein diacylglycerol transferase
MQPLIPYFETVRIPLFGGFAIHGAGALLVLGFAVGMYFALRKARHDGLDTHVLLRVMPGIALAIIIGGHLGSMLWYHPQAIWSDPGLWLRVWEGQSSFGGFTACALLAVWFYRRENRLRQATADPANPPINSWAYLDAQIYGFTAGWFIARLGCFITHDHPGVETDFWLGVYGACPGGSPERACHDMGLYEALWSLCLFLAFTWLDRRPRFPGFFLGVLLVTYALSRFPADFLRHPLVDARYSGLTPAQYGCIVMLLLGTWILYRNRRAVPANSPE